MQKAFGFLALLVWCGSLAFAQTSSDSTLQQPGRQTPIDYSRYGEFRNVGTDEYKYVITDRSGLAQAVGEGIYPNTFDVTQGPLYQSLKKKGKLKGVHWDHVYGPDPLADFFVWATAQEEPGVKLLFTANALKEAGLYMQALKAYYAVLVHYPRSACYSLDHSFVWYVAPVAIDKIYALCRHHPELGVKLQGAFFDIEHGNDTDLGNDVIRFNPGRFVEVIPQPSSARQTLTAESRVAQRGTGEVQLVKYKDGQWQLVVDGQPFIVKGVYYAPTTVGESPHNQTVRNWMFVDDDNNGKTDAAYDAWWDHNRNAKKDPQDKAVGDFALLKKMGCNAIKIYHVPQDNQYKSDYFNKPLLRDLYNTYGIRVIMGDFLGAYTIGSGADWFTGTDYSNPAQCKRMKEIVRRLVMDHKDEPYLLMWVLGNENNMQSDYTGINATHTQAWNQPKAYAQFLNEVAGMIHELDPDHPVAVGNFGLGLMKEYAQYAPNIDILGVNHYPDKDGFGALWEQVKLTMDRPVLITEYGCDAFDTRHNMIDEEGQAIWHRGCWQDILYNCAGGRGDGNAIGGIIFQWIDEWWKSLQGPPNTHEMTADCSMAFPDGSSSEEWLGICSQADGSDSPRLRQLRKAYFVYRELWNQN